MSKLKITIETDDEWTAQHMMNWYEYYSSTKEIYAYIRNKLKHGDVSEEVDGELLNIRNLLPTYYPGED
jgi:hypothetical protein